MPISAETYFLGMYYTVITIIVSIFLYLFLFYSLMFDISFRGRTYSREGIKFDSLMLERWTHVLMDNAQSNLQYNTYDAT